MNHWMNINFVAGWEPFPLRMRRNDETRKTSIWGENEP